jgi:raffinose/stachyose/melibiose transport system permease protein
MAPALILFGTFILYPLFATIQLSFFDWDGLSAERTFVGLENYVATLTRDPVFWTAMRNSLIWVALSLLVPTSLGLLIAMALNQKLAGRTIFRTIFYLPAVLGSIAVATMWRWMYNPNFGAVNYLFNALGLGAFTQSWLGDPNVALFSVFIASAWVVTGLNMVLFLAGLQNVPKELTEAATVDGANRWQNFLNVTVPSLRSTFVIVIALTIINSLKAFDLIVGMTGGGPAQRTQVLALWSYTQSFGNREFGPGNAIATILLGITLLIVIPYLIFTQREDD